MIRRLETTATATAALFAISATFVSPAWGECAPIRPSASSADLPASWRDAITELSRSTAEPGHPWSCSGGSVAIELGTSGATMHITRPGESPIAKSVSTPDEVLPLGQALLALPLAPPEASDDKIVAEPTPPPAASSPDRASAAPDQRRDPRLLLGGGIDARGVGGSGVGWIGPTLSAAVPLGRWLPGLALRQQSSIAGGPPINEVSFALALQYRFPIRAVELRTGLALRGGAVFRDLPRPQGEQTQLQGRVGVLVSLAVPVLSWANVVFSVDGDVVALSRETTAPASTTSESAKPFPTFTVGGTIGIEVPL